MFSFLLSGFNLSLYVLLIYHLHTFRKNHLDKLVVPSPILSQGKLLKCAVFQWKLRQLTHFGLMSQEYVVAIARCRVQYAKYLPSFSYFVTYFTSQPLGKWNESKKQGKNLPILQILTRWQLATTTLSLNALGLM